MQLEEIISTSEAKAAEKMQPRMGLARVTNLRSLLMSHTITAMPRTSARTVFQRFALAKSIALTSGLASSGVLILALNSVDSRNRLGPLGAERAEKIVCFGRPMRRLGQGTKCDAQGGKA